MDIQFMEKTFMVEADNGGERWEMCIQANSAAEAIVSVKELVASDMQRVGLVVMDDGNELVITKPGTGFVKCLKSFRAIMI